MTGPGLNSSNPRPPAVSIEGLSKLYHRTTALKELDLLIDGGAIVGVLGPNGSGKSTLLRTIAGLCRPDAGQVLVSGLPPSPRTKEFVAYVPEGSYLYSWMTLGQTLDFVGSFYEDWGAAKATELIRFMNLRLDHQVGELSKGMKARLRLILAMARNADLVLLDEPLAGIDPPSRARILETMIKEYRGQEQTIVLSTHEVGEVEQVLDRVVFLREGEIVIDANADDLRQERGTSIEGLMREVYQ